MTLKAAWIFDQGREAGEFSNMAKLAAADAGIKAVDTALQCFGGNGFTKEYGIFDIYPLVRLLKTAPLNREMILNYIGGARDGLASRYWSKPGTVRRDSTWRFVFNCSGDPPKRTRLSAMALMKSDVSAASEEYRRNRDAYGLRIADLHERRAAAMVGGPERARLLHKERKRLPASRTDRCAELIPARRSSNFASSRAKACTTACRPAAASSPALEWCRAAPAC